MGMEGKGPQPQTNLYPQVGMLLKISHVNG